MKLRDYEGKYVKLVNSNGNVFTGKAEDYIFPEDNEPEGIESITLYDCPQRSYPVEFYASDIKSIEIIEKIEPQVLTDLWFRFLGGAL